MLTLLFLLLTISSYWGAKLCYKKTGKAFLTPLLIAPLVIIALLFLFQIEYKTYNQGAKWLTNMLQPATVALAIPLYRYFPIVKKHLPTIVLSVTLGSLLALFVSFSMASIVQLNKTLLTSILPYSITTPIAMDASEKLGGIPTVTAVFVIMTGIFGMIFGPWVIRLFRLKSDIAKGILLGTSSHGSGTAKALELSPITGAVSSVCMVLAALVTFWLSPWIYLNLLS
ncbi:LrgB family protein [Lederbergia galactosidilytica]|uniref:LrgB n=1 Tax=Lederbergia galactosidilytica TaxID=217031 RepID=A0A0Q9YAD6_9BACI|nr:LrgB family protein [Lederbergia galactosidilytica]KRG14078.1 LrgB [Lederbergia galactosidilytica]KRG16447.1 LrgB [Virgibacillus soli]MBP1914225.1 putative murein hydrolase (TIGR00659 family) [Lederbergia galactosidilytica]OAK67324.1 LrgB [Lederbergia galactosidilytica]